MGEAGNRVDILYGDFDDFAEQPFQVLWSNYAEFAYEGIHTVSEFNRRLILVEWHC